MQPRNELWEKYGKPPEFDRDQAMALFGIDGVGKPTWQFRAYVYPSIEAFEEFAAENRRRHNGVHGPATTEDGQIIGLIDLGPQVEWMKAGRPADAEWGPS